ncbi:caspase family protein [Bradyrhizobium sp.]|uniref:caspase family protein n=1 Tax=Bradyrhizobium sp. TaxID=376 RepID=UPI004037FE68
MALQPDDNEQGLWINREWTPGTPGVFALIIGVSRYPHLEGGETPAAETYGLKQLPASALTAYRFFDWLRDGYTLAGLPVARARLLLSPQKAGNGSAVDELAGCDAAVCAWAQEATYLNCKTAIERWYAEMQQQPASTASGRSLFFFSGHGMELRQLHQFLLPSDYLRPPVQPLNESIGTRNLIDSLPYLAGVRSHVLLFDGCRNDVDKLRGRNVVGAPILNDNLPSAINPHHEQGVLSATASGLQAYSPIRPGSLSLFGQALLEGLRVKPDPPLDEAPIAVRRKGTVDAIAINPLASYIKGRVAALIKNANESLIQIVRADVSSPDAGNPIDLAEVARAPPLPPASPMIEEIFIESTSDAGEPGGGTSRASRVWVESSARPATGTKPVVPRGAWFDARSRYGAPVRPVAPLPSGATKDENYQRLHDDVFGSEAITIPWMDRLRVSRLSGGETQGWRAIEIKQSAHQDAAIHRVQLHVRIKPPHDRIGHLLTVVDLTGRKLGCVLPFDSNDTLYQLEIDSEKNGGRFIRFAAYISPASPGPAGDVAIAWDRLRALDATEAATSLDKGVLNAKRRAELVLSQKSLSPMGAAVASVLLLKGNRFSMMHDWTRNVANWFKWIPDGIVLWTEQCRRMARGAPLERDLIPWFVRELSQRSLPFTADAMGFAANITDDILQGRIKTDAATRQTAERLAARIDAVTPYFRDDGMFCAYAAWPDDKELASMIGPPSAAAAPANRQTRVPKLIKTTKSGEKKGAKKKAARKKASRKKATPRKEKAASKAAKRRTSKPARKRSRQ